MGHRENIAVLQVSSMGSIYFTKGKSKVLHIQFLEAQSHHRGSCWEVEIIQIVR